MVSSGSGQGQVTDCCKCGNNFGGYKTRGLIQSLRIYLSVKQVSVPCNWLIIYLHVAVRPVGGGASFPHLARPALGPTNSLVQCTPDLYPEDKTAGPWP
jgi:hypothetical protein